MDIVRALETYCTVPCNWSVGETLASLHWAEGNPLPQPTEPDLGAAWAVYQLRRLKAYAAEKRFAVETGGIWVSGTMVRTDRDSQKLIQGARDLSIEDPNTPIDFKSETGWVTIDAATIQAIALAVGQHVRACFAAERAVSEAIDAGMITTIQQVDASAWPSNV